MNGPAVWHGDYVDDPSRQCAGKRTYESRAEAKRAAARHKAHGNGLIGVYRCPHCSMLHLGHPPAGRRARRAG